MRPKQSSLKFHAARGLKWQAIEVGGRQIISLAVFTTLARLLYPSDFGLVGLVALYLVLVNLFVQQGIGTAIIQRQKLDDAHLDAAFWFNLGCATLLCAVSFLVADLVGRIYHEPRLPVLIRWSSLSLIINASATIQGTLFARNLDFRRPALRTFIATAVGGGAGVGVAFLGGGVWALITQQLAASTAGAIFLWFASDWRPRFRFSGRCLRDLFGVSSGVFLIDFLWFISSRVDQMIIGRVLGSTMLGEYVIGNKLSDLVKTVLYQPLGAVSLPAFSRIQDNHTRLRTVMYNGMEINAILSFPLLVGLSCVADELVPFLFGPQWKLASSVLRLMAIYILVTGLNAFFYPALVAVGKPRDFVLINVAYSIGAATACIIGVKYGLIGIIWGLIANAVLMAIPNLFCLHRQIGLNPLKYYQACMLPAMASALMYLAVIGIQHNLLTNVPQWFKLAAEISVGAACYSAVIYVTAKPSISRMISFMLGAIQKRPVTDPMAETLVPA